MSHWQHVPDSRPHLREGPPRRIFDRHCAGMTVAHSPTSIVSQSSRRMSQSAIRNPNSALPRTLAKLVPFGRNLSPSGKCAGAILACRSGAETICPRFETASAILVEGDSTPGNNGISGLGLVNSFRAELSSWNSIV